MTQDQIYQNIAQRTGGDIYLGVVGPVRSGKSTFIKRFAELMLLPRIKNAPVVPAPMTSCPNPPPGAPS